MKKTVTPYKDPEKSKKEQVTQMFDGISTQYDRLNRVISLGIDQSWRRKVVQLGTEIQPHGQRHAESLLSTSEGNESNKKLPRLSEHSH